LLESGIKPEGKELSTCLDLLDETGDATKWLPVLEALAHGTEKFDQPGGKMNLPPLHHAAYLGLEEVCRILLDAGAGPDIADQQGWTALHWAVMKGDLKSSHPEKAAIIQLLLNKGASVNAKSTGAQSLPHTQPYLARRVPANATPTDILDYALPKDLQIEGLLLTNSGVQNLEGEDYRDNGVQLFMAKDYRAAMFEFNRALGKEPESADGLYYRGLCKSELSMHQEAERDLAAALTLKPDYKEAVYARGRALFELGDYQNAILHFDQSIRMDYEPTDCIYLRGKCKLRTGRRAGACKDFTDAEAAGSTEAASARKLYCK
jgi:tetratricopeptide (TPR) repeat protein